jgi:hypothetical protein
MSFRRQANLLVLSMLAMICSFPIYAQQSQSTTSAQAARAQSGTTAAGAGRAAMSGGSSSWTAGKGSFASSLQPRGVWQTSSGTGPVSGSFGTSMNAKGPSAMGQGAGPAVAVPAAVSAMTAHPAARPVASRGSSSTPSFGKRTGSAGVAHFQRPGGLRTGVASAGRRGIGGGFGRSKRSAGSSRTQGARTVGMKAPAVQHGSAIGAGRGNSQMVQHGLPKEPTPLKPSQGIHTGLETPLVPTVLPRETPY